MGLSNFVAKLMLFTRFLQKSGGNLSGPIISFLNLLHVCKILDYYILHSLFDILAAFCLALLLPSILFWFLLWLLLRGLLFGGM